MAASILVRDILSRVSTQLLDATPQFERWTERELVYWLNDAQRAIAKYIPQACSRVDAIRLAPGTKQAITEIQSSDVIPGDSTQARVIRGIAVQDVVRNMGTTGSSPGRAIKRIDRETLDAANPDWHSAKASSPVREYAFDPRTPTVFYVSPPAPVGWWVEVSYMANPDEIPNPGNAYAADGTSMVKISIDDKHTDDIVNYVLARAHLKDAEFAGNASLASSFTALFTSSINAQAVALTGVNPNLESLPLSPSPLAAAK